MADDEPVEILGDGRWIRLLSRGGWEYAERVGSPAVAVVIAVTDEGRLLLTEQFRPAVRRHVIELPAGLVGDQPGQADESAAEAARRELLEETGYRAERVEPLFRGAPSPGTTSELHTVFRAHGLRRAGPGGGDETEAIVVHEVPVAELRTWLRDAEERGRLVDSKLWSALLLFDDPA